MARDYIRWFEEIGIGDVASVGGKNASLGEMVRNLGRDGIKVPPGFATTADGYRHFIEANNLETLIASTLAELKGGKVSVAELGLTIRGAILKARCPEDLAGAICQAYRDLSQRLGMDEADVAVRSSATAEDLPDASFAGQQETFLNVRGEAAVLDACRRCFASLFTDRAISYREAKGFDHLKVALSIGVQQMVRSDLAGAGVMFSIDTETGFDRVVLINAAWGLGENVVQGTVDPDEYQVFKPLLADTALKPIVHKRCGGKALKMIYAQEGEQPTRNVPTSLAERSAYVLTDAEILQLARSACAIERHYGWPDGHRMGEGREERGAVHRASAPGDRAVACASGRAAHLQDRAEGPKARLRPQHRRCCRFWPGLHHSRSQEYRPLRVRRGAGDNHHQSRLGADHETRGSDRHRSRRAHVPCRHRQPGAWGSGDRRHRAMPPRCCTRSNT